MDPYATLGVNASATGDEIRVAYRAAALRWHPDRQGGDAAAFRRASEAYETLRDASRRAAYDAEHTPIPRLSPDALDLGVIERGVRVVRTVWLCNEGGGEPEVRLDRDRGAAWRILRITGSTAPGAGVTIEIEVDTSGAATGRVDQALIVSFGRRSASLAIRFTVAEPRPAAGSWRPASPGVWAPAPAASAAIPGWGWVMDQPRWRLAGAAAIAGAVLPLALLSNQHGATSTTAVLLAISLAAIAIVVAYRTEGFEPNRLAQCGPGDQAGVEAVTGVGAATAVVFIVAIAIALVLVVLIGAALLAALSDS